MSTEPLSLVVDLGTVDTDRPCLVDGAYVCSVALEIKANKAGNGRNLVATFTTTGPGQSTKGVSVPPGYTMTEYYPLQANPEKPEQDMWQKKLARLYDALNGTDNATRPGALDFSNAAGKTVVVTTKIETDPQFGDRPRVNKVEFHRA